METESVRVDKNVLNRLRMHIVQRSEGRVYGEIGATVEKAIKEYLDKEENCHKLILSKKMNFFNLYVDTKSEASGRVVMLSPVFKGNPHEKEDTILIRAGANELKLTLRSAGEEIDNDTEIRLVLEDKSTGDNQKPVGHWFYEELKNGITIEKEVRIPVHRALSIYVPNYHKEIHAENIRFQVDLCPGMAK